MRKVYWTLQSLSSEDGWTDWSGDHVSMDAAERAIDNFRRVNNVQPIRILKHTHTSEVVFTDRR